MSCKFYVITAKETVSNPGRNKIIVASKVLDASHGNCSEKDWRTG